MAPGYVRGRLKGMRDIATAALHRGQYFKKLRSGVPIIVCQMGKVGSVSVRDSLESSGIDSVFHVHRLNPDNIRSVQQDYLDHNRTPPSEGLGERLYRDVVQQHKQA